MKNLFAPIRERWYRWKNRRRLTEAKRASVYGFAVSSESIAFSDDRLLLRSLVNAAIMFLLVFGTALSFILPFEINANIGFLAFFYLLVSLFFSLINCRRLWQNVGYILFFILFTTFLIMFRSFINSGLNGMLNDFFAIISDKLEFPMVKTYNEAYEAQHYMAVTTFFMVVGVAFLLLINFVFNNEQSPATLLCILFPILQMALYVDEFPGIPVFLMVAIGLMICGSLRHNFQFRLPLKKKNVFSLQRPRDEYNMQLSSGRVVWQVAAVVSAILILLTLVITTVFPPDHFRPTKEDLALKTSTQPTVAQVLMYGITSLFYSDSGWDAAMGGQLGQTSTVYQDFQTDLQVTFAPYLYDTVYLRSSTFTDYSGVRWMRSETDSMPYTGAPFETKTAPLLRNDRKTDNRILHGRMLIDIVDPINVRGIFQPYYAENPDSVKTYSLHQETEYYVAQDFWNSDYYKNEPAATAEEELLRRTYTALYQAVPGVNDLSDQITTTLAQVCREQNFSGSTKEIIEQIQTYLKDGFVYTLNPGRLPNGKDFVTYFLTDSKKGYCTYFATAGCLLLRSLGIPARYVEGYVINMSSVASADILADEKYEDWLEGDASVGKTAVITADITDASAHAWCEVYINGFGWVPVEFTVAGTMDESDKDSWNIWDRLGDVDTEDGAGGALMQLFGANFGTVFAWIGRVLLGLMLLALPFVGYRLYRYYVTHRREETIHYSSNNKRVMRDYQALVKRLQRKKLLSEPNPVPDSVAEALVAAGCDTATVQQLLQLYRDAAFSPDDLSEAQVHTWQTVIRSLRF